MAETAKPRSKSGLEAIVTGLVDMDEAPNVTAQKVSAPLNNGVIQPKAIVRPAQGGKGGGAYQGPVILKGSQIAPKRDSSADLIDGRAARAKDRNARLNLSLSSNVLNAFKWWARDNGSPCYNDVFSDWVAQNCSEHLRLVIEAARAKEDESL